MTCARPLALYTVEVIAADLLVTIIVIATDTVGGRTGGRIYNKTDNERLGRNSGEGRMRTIAVGWRSSHKSLLIIVLRCGSIELGVRLVIARLVVVQHDWRIYGIV